MENYEKNPWRVTQSNVVYANNWIKVVHNDVLTPAGNPGIYGVVQFKNTAIGVVPLDEDGNTWLVGQYRFPLGKYSWEIPEGGCSIELNENELDAGKRELREETGLIAQKWTSIATIHTSNSVCNEVGTIFLAEEIEMTTSEPEETEQLIVRKLPFKEALNMVLNDEITDSLSVAGILKVARLKGY
ncbi:MAG: NUDIX domain-containing protein [Spirosomataceae bacterium]